MKVSSAHRHIAAIANAACMVGKHPPPSYLFLRGRCRTCGAAIGIRYLIVELAVGALWALQAYRSVPVALYPPSPPRSSAFRS